MDSRRPFVDKLRELAKTAPSIATMMGDHLSTPLYNRIKSAKMVSSLTADLMIYGLDECFKDGLFASPNPDQFVAQSDGTFLPPRDGLLFQYPWEKHPAMRVGDGVDGKLDKTRVPYSSVGSELGYVFHDDFSKLTDQIYVIKNIDTEDEKISTVQMWVKGENTRINFNVALTIMKRGARMLWLAKTKGETNLWDEAQYENDGSYLKDWHYLTFLKSHENKVCICAIMYHKTFRDQYKDIEFYVNGDLSEMELFTITPTNIPHARGSMVSGVPVKREREYEDPSSSKWGKIPGAGSRAEMWGREEGSGGCAEQRRFSEAPPRAIERSMWASAAAPRRPSLLAPRPTSMWSAQSSVVKQEPRGKPMDNDERVIRDDERGSAWGARPASARSSISNADGGMPRFPSMQGKGPTDRDARRW